MSFFVGVIATGVVFAVLAGAAYVTSARVLPVQQAPTRQRLCGAAVVFLALYALVFYGTMAAGRFTGVGLAVGSGLFASLAWAVGRGAWETALRADLEVVGEQLKWAFGGWRLLASVPVGAFVVANLWRSLVIPPLAWDSLTYHLTRGALWIKESGLSSYEAPGSWDSYKHMMPLGDALSAGVMVMPSSDALVPLVWLAVWCGFAGAVYTAARELGAGREMAWLGALAAGFLPAIKGAIFVAYVDNLVAAAALLAFALMLRAEKERDPGALLLGVAALGVGFATKKSGIPFFGVGGLVVLVWAIREFRRESGVRRAMGALAGAAAVAVALVGPPTIYLYVTEGSLLYPWQVDPMVLLEFFQGGGAEGAQPVKAAASSAGGTGGAGGPPTAKFLRYLFWEGYQTVSWNHLNYGPVAPVWGLLGLWGLVAYLRGGKDEEKAGSRATWTVLGFALGAGAMIYYILDWPRLGLNIARYSAGGVGVVLALAAAAGGADGEREKWLRRVFVAGLLVQAVYCLPTNWSATGTWATLQFALASVPFAVVAVLLVMWGNKQGWPKSGGAVAGAAAVMLLCLATVLEPIRSLYRYDIYEEAARANAYSNHPVAAMESFQAGPMWEFLDRPGASYRTSVTVGWAGHSVNWFVYPFFGQRLQNDITYAPVTRDGTMLPLRDKIERSGEASYRAWRGRLLEERVDFVAALAPWSVEVKAMKTSPEAFRLVRKGRSPNNLLYVVLPPGGVRAEVAELLHLRGVPRGGAKGGGR